MKKVTKQIIAMYTASMYLALLVPSALSAEPARNNVPRYIVPTTQRDTPVIALQLEEDGSVVTDKKGVLVAATQSESVGAVITATEGGTIVAQGAEIDIPPGALEKNTEIRITRLPATEATGDELMNVTSGGGGWRFEPAGTQFLKPVTIRMGYDVSINESPDALENLYTYFYNTAMNRWERLERVGIDKTNLRLSSSTTHFTDMINATLTLPEGPSPLSFNINSIKNLEAADPSTGVAKLEGLEGDSFGGGNFRINFQLPSGRAGMTPQVALTYSSTGAGLCGRGFDIQAGGSISTDTRWGLPDYGNYTNNTYVKDGVVLVGDDNNTKDSTVRRYYREKETGYEEIRWIASGSDNYWQVTDKSGVIRTYGRNGNSWNGIDEQSKYTWYLSEERDVHGNTITYTYVKYDDYVYIDTISYTGYENVVGPYKVKFHYDDRKDARVDGRGKFTSIQGKLITDVWIGYEDAGKTQEIRSYFFEQEFSKLGFTQLMAFGQRLGEQVFYRYTFDYYMPKWDEATSRYKIFADVEEWKLDRGIQVSESVNTGVNASGSGGGGFGFKKVDARISIGGSASSSDGESQVRQTLVDIDGDGLPDSVTKSSRGVKVRYQNEQGFIHDDIPEVDLANSPKINFEKQKGRSVGWNVYGGVGLDIPINPELGMSYATTYQDSWTDLHTSFMDVDGDGRQDFIIAEKSYYLKNLGGRFEKRDFRTVAGSFKDTVVQIPPEKKARYDVAFYQQTPFRAWKAPKSGTLEVTHTVSTNQGSSDGVKARTYYADNTEPSQVLSIPAQPADDPATKEYTVDENKSLYFVPDGVMYTDGDCLDWNTKIKYNTIQYFSGFTGVNRYCPPAVISDQMYYSFPATLQKIYKSNELLDYIVDTQWEQSSELTSLQKTAIAEQLIERGYFIPSVLSSENFGKLASKLNSINDTELRNAYKTLFYSYYVFDQVSDTYYHTRRSYDISQSGVPVELSDGSFVNSTTCILDLISKLNRDTCRDIGLYTWINGKRGASWNNENNFFERFAKPKSVDTRVLNAPGYREIGGKTLYIDEVEGRTWKINHEASVPELISVDSDGTELEVEDVNVTVGQSGSLLYVNVSTTDPGTNSKLYDQIYHFTDYRRITDKISPDEMAIIRSDKVSYCTPDNEFWKILPASQLAKIELALSGEQYAAFCTFYDVDPEDSDSFILREELTEAETAEFAGLLEVYALYVLLNEIFPYYALTGDWYTLKSGWDPDIDDDYRDELDPVKDKETLAGYHALIDYTEEYKLGYWRTVNRSIRYYADSVYTVSDNSISLYDLDFDKAEYTRVSVEIPTWNSNSDYSTENLALNVASYTASVPSYEGNDIPENFNFINPVYENVEMKVETSDVLYGGAKRWLYGIWHGTQSNGYAFCEEVLYSNKVKYKNLSMDDDAEEKAREEADVKAIYEDADSPDPKIATPYSLPNTPGLEYMIDDNDTAKTCEEFTEENSQEEVNKDYLIGTITELTSEELVIDDDKTDLVKEVKTYCPLIHRDTININRVGGSSYYTIPGIMSDDAGGHTGGQGNSSAFEMVSLRKSSGKATDVVTGLRGSIDLEKTFPSFTGAGSVEGTIGDNSGSSSMYQSVQDINGDGIVDIISSSGSGISVFSGARSATPDAGVVFNRFYSMSGGGDLSYNSNESTVYGASLNASGSMKLDMGGNSKPKNIIFNTGSKGGSRSESTNVQEKGLLDLTGDGLPDYVTTNTLGVNIGSSFETFDKLTDSYVLSLGISTNEMENYGLSASISRPTGSSLSQSSSTKTVSVSLAGGVSYSASINQTKDMFMDINGDGLPDKIRKNEGDMYLSAYINYGSSFSETPIRIEVKNWKLNPEDAKPFVEETDGNIVSAAITSLPIVGDVVKSKGVLNDAAGGKIPNPFGEDINNYIDVLSYNSSVSIGITGSVNVKGDIAIPLPWPVNFLAVHVSASGGGGVNGNVSLSGVSVMMTDIDGDGLVDHVLRVPGTEKLYVKRNITQNMGLLKTITLPQGGNYELAWKRVGNTKDMPQSRTCLDKVTLSDSPDTKNEVPGSVTSYVTEFNYIDGKYDRATKDFWGFKLVESVYADGSKKVTRYANDAYYSKGMATLITMYAPDGTKLSEQENTLDAKPFARVTGESRTQLESGGSSITTTMKYEYDMEGYGNITFVRDCGGTKDDESDDVTAHITYWNNGSKGLHNHPLSIKVFTDKGLIRSRTTTYYEDSGKMKTLSQETGTGDPLFTRLEWDDYGNLAAIEGIKGDRTEYTYDSTYNQYVTGIKRGAHGISAYESAIEWDMTRGVKEAEIDENDNRMRYSYDEFLRLQTVVSPYDDENGTPAVEYSYVTPEGVSGWYAVTNNKILTDSSDDGIMQTVTEVDGLGRKLRMAKRGEKRDDDGTRCYGWNVSGAVTYDEKGRTVAEGQNVFIDGTLNDLLDTRITGLINPTEKKYDFQDRVTRVFMNDSETGALVYEQRTKYGINGLTAWTENRDPKGSITLQERDPRGNITAVIRMDASRKELTRATYEYNPLGEMVAARDSADNEIIVEYDLLGRKTAIESMDSGRKETWYDQAGNVLRETDNVLRAKGKFIQYEYDAMNRLTKIDYPVSDDTLYEYGPAGAKYNSAGRIVRMQDESGSIEYQYGKLGEIVREERTIKRLTPLADHVTAVMEYTSDYLGRMQSITFDDGEVVTYGYDEGGQIKSVHGVRIGHDFEYVNDIAYDEFGQRKYIEYGNGTRTTYTYDPQRRWLSNIKTLKESLVYQDIDYEFDVVGNISSYINSCNRYETKQEYTYDSLYQLTGVSGTTVNRPYGSVSYIAKYKQNFVFSEDGLCNMEEKASSSSVTPRSTIGKDLNYKMGYAYYDGYAHRLEKAGTRYYRYDGNGNVITEREGGHAPVKENNAVLNYDGDMFSTDYGFALSTETGDNGSNDTRYQRDYQWNERNLLVNTTDRNYSVTYVYGSDGQRSNKYSSSGETLYFNKMWQTTNTYGTGDLRQSKHIYVGDSRLVTKFTVAGKNDNWRHEDESTYWYHSDHLGSAQLVTKRNGTVHERIEYTPYGELWVEANYNDVDKLPFRFTGKEFDEETGFYYYGARYLDPRLSRWISTDPALGEYIPGAPVNEEARKRNGNLPGMGGVYNTINLNLYHYAGNNPLKYIDPDGRITVKQVVDAAFKALKFLTHADPIGKSNNCNTNRSLYNQQFHTTRDQEGGDMKFISATSAVPGPLGYAATVASLTIIPSEPEGIVSMPQRRGFINGATFEINRINNILAEIVGNNEYEVNDRGQSFRDFLLEQRDFLENEILNNAKAYEGQLKGINEWMEKLGNPQIEAYGYDTPESWVKPIDYYELFRSQKKAGIDE